MGPPAAHQPSQASNPSSATGYLANKFCGVNTFKQIITNRYPTAAQSLHVFHIIHYTLIIHPLASDIIDIVNAV